MKLLIIKVKQFAKLSQIFLRVGPYFFFSLKQKNPATKPTTSKTDPRIFENEFAIFPITFQLY